MKAVNTHITLFFLAVMLVLFPTNHAFGSRMAILPLADISSEENGIFDDITEAITQKAVDLGFSVVGRQDMVSFLIENNIRQFGYLQTHQILLAKTEMNADYILLGSVCEKNKSPLIFGLTLTLYRTKDAFPLWTFSEGIGIDEGQRLLGIDTPTTFPELREALLKKLFAAFPTINDLSVTAGSITQKQSVMPDFEIEAAYIFPQHVRTGQKITCSLKLRSLREQDAKPRVFIKAGNAVYQAMETRDGKAYEVSWQAPKPPPEKKVEIAMYPPENLFFEGSVAGEDADENYLVSVQFVDDRGKLNTAYIGSYTVDNTPPQITVTALGKNFEGKTYFHDDIPLQIRQVNSEPISRWSLSIFDEDGLLIMKNDGRDGLPSQLRWLGTLRSGSPAIPGDYRIVAEVLDRAGNKATGETTVSFFPQPPDVAFRLSEDGEKNIEMYQKDFLPITSWRLEIWDTENNLLSNLSGDTLPAKVVTDLASLSTDKGIIATVFAKNILGNTVKSKVSETLIATINSGNSLPSQEAAPPTGRWINNF